MKEITCIIVDDEEKVANRMKNLVSKFTDLDVIHVETTAEKAIEKICSLKPDIVFLDIEMPGKTGFELINEIRNRNCNPTYILVTAHDHYAIKAVRESAFDYLMKPVDIDELKECIERYKKSINGKEKVIVKPDNIKLNLSKREKEVLALIIKGFTSKEIAVKLFISKTTVDTHRQNILSKTGARTTTELIALVLNNPSKHNI